MIFYQISDKTWKGEKELRQAYDICIGYIGVSFENFVENIKNNPAFNVRIFDHEPTVIEYLKMGRTIDAVYRYRELHKCDLRTAKDMVDKIREDMHKMEKFGTLKKSFKKRKVHKDA